MKSCDILKRPKRIILVNRDFQLRYVKAAVLVGIASALVTTTVILLPLYQFRILRIAQFLPIPVLIAMCLAVIVNIMMVGFMGLFITHKIAGPMYSLVRAFRRIEHGVWFGELQKRRGDDLSYVVRNFNNMLEAIHKKTAQDVNLVSKLIESTEALEKSLQNKSVGEVKQGLISFRQELESRVSPKVPFNKQ